MSDQTKVTGIGTSLDEALTAMANKAPEGTVVVSEHIVCDGKAGDPKTPRYSRRWGMRRGRRVNRPSMHRW